MKIEIPWYRRKIGRPISTDVSIRSGGKFNRPAGGTGGNGRLVEEPAPSTVPATEPSYSYSYQLQYQIDNSRAYAGQLNVQPLKGFITEPDPFFPLDIKRTPKERKPLDGFYKDPPPAFPLDIVHVPERPNPTPLPGFITEGPPAFPLPIQRTPIVNQPKMLPGFITDPAPSFPLDIVHTPTPEIAFKPVQLKESTKPSDIINRLIEPLSMLVVGREAIKQYVKAEVTDPIYKGMLEDPVLGFVLKEAEKHQLEMEMVVNFFANLDYDNLDLDELTLQLTALFSLGMAIRFIVFFMGRKVVFRI